MDQMNELGLDGYIHVIVGLYVIWFATVASVAGHIGLCDLKDWLKR